MKPTAAEMEINPFQQAFGQALDIYSPLVCDIIFQAKEICKATKLKTNDDANVRFVAQLLMDTHQAMSVLAMTAAAAPSNTPVQNRVMTIHKN